MAVRNWVFSNTPFGLITSYMKKDNLASAAVARANRMVKSYEFTDPEGEQTVVYEITRKNW